MAQQLNSLKRALNALYLLHARRRSKRATILLNLDLVRHLAQRASPAEERQTCVCAASDFHARGLRNLFAKKELHHATEAKCGH